MRINNKKIDIPESNGTYTISNVEDFEFINPIEHIASIYINTCMSVEREVIDPKKYNVSQEIIEKILFKRAIKSWNDEYIRYLSIELPDKLFSIFESKKKRDQENALKGISLSTDEFIAFIIKAHEKYNYKYSQYATSHNHKGLTLSQLPKLVHIKDDGSIITIGKTNMTNGQLKQYVEHRKIIVAKFLDNDTQWHCFFLSSNSLFGKESYNNGIPHLHYISDKWNIERKEVIEQLTNKDYHLPSLPHIDYHSHRNPRELDK